MSQDFLWMWVIFMKMERISYVNGKYQNDVRNVKVEDYKKILEVGNSVIIEGKKYIQKYDIY